MKWHSNKRAISSRTNAKTFLVLPLVDDSEMNKNPGLRLFTKTWPPKNDKEDVDENTRPLTATLDKPQVLDIRLIGKIDMSLMRKEFLTISNLCRIPLTAMHPRRKTALIERRRPLSNLPLALSPNDKAKYKRKSDATSDDSVEEESSLSSREGTRKLKSRIRPPTIVIKKLDKSNEINNNNFKIKRKQTPTVVDIPLKASPKTSTKQLPEPCTTCGRPDLPERFHSHPNTPLKPIKRIEAKIPMKNTVQKPVAIKYKSKLETKIEERKMSLPAQKLLHTPPVISESKVVSAKGPRTLTCYICAREFGTASLPLHEPKCLQKWERENATLPSHLQKQAPIKPQGNLTKAEWNRSAWEASQASLVPCQNCGRTFYPDRLLVHQRSCKQPHRAQSNETVKVLNSNVGPPTVQCAHCNKLFGTKSIKIHEPQCLKKLHLRNDHLSAEKREANPGKTGEKSSVKAQDEARPSSGKRPAMLPCYLCGRLFSLSSIYIHEPQCLKKWRLENEKLPPSRQRQEPQKPDIKFTQDGKIDFNATDETIWQCHLSQLVPCKLCKRTFNPDRVEVHERSCKGPN